MRGGRARWWGARSSNLDLSQNQNLSLSLSASHRQRRDEALHHDAVLVEDEDGEPADGAGDEGVLRGKRKRWAFEGRGRGGRL